MGRKMRFQWHREACWECGVEGLASRTIPTPVDQPYLCDLCEGYKDAEKDFSAQFDQLLTERDQLKAERDQLKAEVERLQMKQKPFDDDNRLHEYWKTAPREEILNSFAFMGAVNRSLTEMNNAKSMALHDIANDDGIMSRQSMQKCAIQALDYPWPCGTVDEEE